MDYTALANLLFPEVTKTPEEIEAQYPMRDLPEGAMVTRIAPSPTGFVHFGNLFPAITSERMAHTSGGVFYLRIEDTDAKREVEGATEVILDSFSRFSINFDEGATIDGDNGKYGPYRQRQRAEIYHVFAKQLVLQGQAYPCFCTQDELEAIHEEQQSIKSNTLGYFGKWAIWRDRPIEDIKDALSKNLPYVLRFRSTGSDENKIKHTDLVKGQLDLTENNIDHVLLKSDGIPTYHFAHVVDDHLMRTTHVVRGDEWLSTLAFHLQMFNALSWRAPKYLHISPLMKQDGATKRKLSKRKDPETALTFYTEQGYPSEAVYSYILTLLNSNYEDWQNQNPDKHMTEFPFSYKKMSVSGALFDIVKLYDISKNYVSRMTAEQVYDAVSVWAKQFNPDFYELFTKNPEYSKAILSIGRGGKKPRKDIGIWSDVPDYMSYFFDETFKMQDSFDEKISKEMIIKILTEYTDIFDISDDNSVWFEKIRQMSDKLGFCGDMKAYKQNPDAYLGSVADVSMVIRVAVCGRTNSPDMYQILQILGKDCVIKRLNDACALLKG